MLSKYFSWALHSVSRFIQQSTHHKQQTACQKQTVCLYHSLRFLQQTALFYFPSTIFFSLSIRMIVSSTVRTAHMIVLSPATQPTIS